MTNIAPNLVHAIDLAHLKEMNIETNALGESIIRTPEGDLTDRDIMTGMYGSNLHPWQTKALKLLMAMDPKDLSLRAEYRQELKEQTFTARYGGRGSGKPELQKALAGYRADFVILDEASEIREADWKRTMYQQDKHSCVPSEEKRAALRAKRKKKAK